MNELERIHDNVSRVELESSMALTLSREMDRQMCELRKTTGRIDHRGDRQDKQIYNLLNFTSNLEKQISKISQDLTALQRSIEDRKSLEGRINTIEKKVAWEGKNIAELYARLGRKEEAKEVHK